MLLQLREQNLEREKYVADLEKVAMLTHQNEIWLIFQTKFDLVHKSELLSASLDREESQRQATTVMQEGITRKLMSLQAMCTGNRSIDRTKMMSTINDIVSHYLRKRVLEDSEITTT